MDMFWLEPVRMICLLFLFTWKVFNSLLQLNKFFNILIERLYMFATFSLLSPVSNKALISFLFCVKTQSFPPCDAIAFIKSVSSAFPVIDIARQVVVFYLLCTHLLDQGKQDSSTYIERIYAISLLLSVTLKRSGSNHIQQEIKPIYSQTAETLSTFTAACVVLLLQSKSLST